MTTESQKTKLPPVAERALADAGIVLAVVTNPTKGQDATFEYANEALVEFMGTQVGALQGNRFAVVMSRIADSFARQKLLEAMVRSEPGKHDIPITIAGAERWLGVTITFPPREGGPSRMTMIGKDITGAMANLTREQKSKLLLTSMFTQMGSAIALILGTGQIVMANAAFHAVVRTSANETTGMMLDDFIAPEHAKAEREATDRQTQDGRAYEHDVALLTRTGERIDVKLASTPLAFERKQYRLVTVTPGKARARLTPEFEASVDGSKGDLRPISLGAIRQAFGESWSRVGIKVMISAEKTLRTRLGANDLVIRLDDETFAIWFESANRPRNDDVVAQMTRDVRIRLMTEFANSLNDGRDGPRVAMVSADEPKAA